MLLFLKCVKLINNHKLIIITIIIIKQIINNQFSDITKSFCFQRLRTMFRNMINTFHFHVIPLIGDKITLLYSLFLFRFSLTEFTRYCNNKFVINHLMKTITFVSTRYDFLYEQKLETEWSFFSFDSLIVPSPPFFSLWIGIV